MSSIYGILNFQQKPIDAEVLPQMQTSLNHWKADDLGTWKDGSVGLGHLMLWNTPESLKEKLPYINKTNSLVITSDARIDNREELFLKLAIQPSERKDITDSELILLSYQKYGENCVAHLIGDFAFAIWNQTTRQLYCVRDQMGVKPFFYYFSDQIFAFASEKKGILCLEGIDKSIDKDFFYAQIMLPPCQSHEGTIYKKIRRLKPAYCLSINLDNRQMKTKQYWDFDTRAPRVEERESVYQEGLLHHFNEAVKCRVRSAFSVGTELSGGVDSCVIAGAAKRYLEAESKTITSFSNTLPDNVSEERHRILDERLYIDAAIQFHQILNHVYVTQKYFKNPLEEIDFSLMINDGLEMWNPLWQIPSKVAAFDRTVRTLFSGFPGDEFISYKGGNRRLDLWEQRRYLAFFKDQEVGLLSKLFQQIPNYCNFPIHKIRNLFSINIENLKWASNTFNLPFEQRIKWNDGEYNNIYWKERNQSFRHMMRYRLMKPQVSLRMESETRYGIHYRMEPRFPMADIRLTQYYLSAPNHLKYEGVERLFFKKTFEQYLPEMFLKREKKGFGSVAPFFQISTNQEVLGLQFKELFTAVSLHSRWKKVISKQGASIKEGSMNYLEHLRWMQKNNIDYF